MKKKHDDSIPDPTDSSDVSPKIDPGIATTLGGEAVIKAHNIVDGAGANTQISPESIVEGTPVGVFITTDDLQEYHKQKPDKSSQEAVTATLRDLVPPAEFTDDDQARNSLGLKYQQEYGYLYTEMPRTELNSLLESMIDRFPNGIVEATVIRPGYSFDGYRHTSAEWGEDSSGLPEGFEATIQISWPHHISSDQRQDARMQIESWGGKIEEEEDGELRIEADRDKIDSLMVQIEQLVDSIPRDRDDSKDVTKFDDYTLSFSKKIRKDGRLLRLWGNLRRKMSFTA